MCSWMTRGHRTGAHRGVEPVLGQPLPRGGGQLEGDPLLLELVLELEDELVDESGR